MGFFKIRKYKVMWLVGKDEHIKSVITLSGQNLNDRGIRNFEELLQKIKHKNIKEGNTYELYEEKTDGSFKKIDEATYLISHNPESTMAGISNNNNTSELVNELRQRNAELSTELSEAREAISSYRNKANNLKNENSGLSGLSSQIAQLEQANDDLQERLESAENGVSTRVDEAVGFYKDQTDELTNENTEYQTTLEGLQEKLETQKDLHIEKLTEKQNTIIGLENDIKRTKELSDMKAELRAEFKIEKEEYDSLLDKQDKQIKKYKDEVGKSGLQGLESFVSMLQPVIATMATKLVGNFMDGDNDETPTQAPTQPTQPTVEAVAPQIPFETEAPREVLTDENSASREEYLELIQLLNPNKPEILETEKTNSEGRIRISFEEMAQANNKPFAEIKQVFTNLRESKMPATNEVTNNEVTNHVEIEQEVA